jgi:hypothetical protein
LICDVTNPGDRSHRGSARDKHPLRPWLMVRVCRELAIALRKEHAMGWGPVQLTCAGNHHAQRVTRLEAADAMDQQADRWQAEIDTGIPNKVDREKLGEL